MAKSMKKLLSLALAVIMVLSLVPAVSATEEQEIDETFQISELSELTAVLKADSAQNLVANATYKFVLQEDITVNIAGALYIGDYVSGTGGHGVNVIIDLNKHTLTDAYSGTKNRLFAAYEGSSLTIMNGKIVSNTAYKSKGGVFFGEGGSDFTLDNVTVEITSPNTSQGGVLFASGSGSVVTLNDSTFTRTAGDCADHGGMIAMSGGQLNLNNSHISGGRVVATETGDPSLGGNIYLEAGAVATMNGGSITNGYVEGKTATDIPPASGGNVYVNGKSTKFILNSGTISGGEAKITGTGYCTGGNVGLAGAALANASRAYFVMNGGQVINGKVTYGTGGSSSHRRGANFGLYEACNLTINDGLVQGGDTAYRGTNIDMWTTSCAVEITGGTITGGGIYITGQLLVKGGLLDQAGITIAATYVSYVRVYGGTILHSGGFSKAFGGNKATSASGGLTGWVSTTYIYGGKMNFEPQTLYGDKVDAESGEVTSVMYRGVVESCSEVIAPTAGEELYVVKHKDNDTSVTVPATCTEKGSIKTTCTECNFNRYNMKFDGKYTYEIPALGHAWDEGVVDPKPTCNDAGVKTYTCANCSETKTEAVDATGHTEETIPGKDATCTETGLTEGKKCTVCGTVTVAQTEIPVLKHTEETIPGKDATCTETGLTEGKKCTVCGTVTVAQNEIPAIGHKYESTKTDATFEADAFTTHTCSVCGYSYVETHEGTKLTAVATADGVPFETLQEALTAGGTVVLLQDIADSDALEVKNTVVLDLNGKTVSMTDASGKAAQLIKNSGNLTIMDSAGSGKLTFHSTTPSASNSYSTSTIINIGTLKIVSGTIENTTTSGPSYAIDNAWYTTDVSLSVEGGVVTAVKPAIRQVPFSTTAKNTITISGGEISGYAGLQIHNYQKTACLSDVTITGGTLTGSYAFYTSYSYNNTATGTNIAINGGVFNGYVYLYNGKAGSSDYPMTVSVTGGTFNSGYYAYCNDSTGAMVSIPSVTGGTHIYDVTDYCVEGYGMHDNGDGTYGIHQHTYKGVKTEATFEADAFTTYTCEICGDSYTVTEEGTKLTAVATADGVPFETLQEALTAGGTVVLLQDVTATEKLTAATTATLDLGGYTLTLADVAGNYALIVKGELTVVGNGTIVAPGGYGIGVTGKLTVNGGNFFGDQINDYIIGNWGEVTINDGFFMGIYNVLNNFAGKAAIYGGQFITEDTDYTGEYESCDLLGENITVYGGQFSKAVDSAYLAPNYAYITTGEVVKLADVIADDIVTLESDVTMTEKLTVTGTTILDLNGHTLTLADLGYAYGMVVTGTLKIVGNGTIVAPGGFGIGVNASGYLTIENGTFIAGQYNDYIVGNYGVTVINGGTFQGVYNCVNNFAGITKIYGGTYTTAAFDWSGEYESADLFADAGLTVFGGTYSKPVAPEFCAENLCPKANADGTFTVTEKAAFAKAPASVTAAAGETVTFTVETLGDIAGFRWEYSRDGITWFNTKMEGATTDTLTVPVLLSRNGYQYRCVISDIYGNGATSEAAILTVNQPAGQVQITNQPTAQEVFAGAEAVFTVEATGDGLQYQWQYSRDGKNWYYTGMTGAKTAQLTVTATAARNGYQYRCVIKDSYGNQVTTEAATLTVTEKTITTSGPADQVAVSGKAVFTVNVEGENLTYTWQYKRLDSSKWFYTTMEGCNTDTLTVIATKSRNGYKYRCIITDAYGNETVSQEATLTVE